MKSHSAPVVLLAVLVCTVPLPTAAQVQDTTPEKFAFTPSTATARMFKPDPENQGKILQSYGKLPLRFEANQGRKGCAGEIPLARCWLQPIFDLGRSSAGVAKTSADMKDSSTIESTPTANKSALLHMQLLGSNPASPVSGVDEMPGRSNYFIGNDPKKWRTNVANYAKVCYAQVYPGVDLVYYGNQGKLEYDFVVAPGANPSRIRFKFRGPRALRIDDKGDLVLGADGEQVRLQKPQVYQEARGTRKSIEGRYWMEGANTISFRVADYDRSKPLVIDPVLVYSTYLGGSGGDGGQGIAVDSVGNAYVTGFTESTDFPTVNAIQSTLRGVETAFVTKINASGTALVYSTYIGGSGGDGGQGIAVDSVGNAYVTGFTGSSDFPTVNAIQSNLKMIGQTNAFITKINATGSELVYSTYLGGSGGDGGQGIAVDSVRNAYVTGSTSSDDFPTVNAIQSSLARSAHAFITKINASGTSLVYSTYLGGSSSDNGQSIAVDSVGNAYVTGSTLSTDFPTVNAIQSMLTGVSAAFITKINATGTALVYSTYLGGSGGSGNASGASIAVDSVGNAYVTGVTQSSDFPTVNAIQSTLRGIDDVFVTKINASGTALVYSTYLGGSGLDVGYGIAVDFAGNAYVTGYTSSDDFPTVNAIQSTRGDKYEAFVTKINASGTALVYSTYLGGSGLAEGEVGPANSVAVDAVGNAYVTGATNDPKFPTVNAIQSSLVGDLNSFVSKIGSQVTFASLIKLVKEFDTKPTVAAIMIATLEGAQLAADVHAAKVVDALLDAFIDEVSEQSGKSLTAAQAAILIQDATALKI